MPVQALPVLNELLRDEVMRELEWDAQITAPLGVVATDGVVTLTGFVDNYGQKLAAERAAKRVYGVHAVANEVQVRPVGSRTDPEIAAAAAEAVRNRLGPTTDVKVTVRDGALTLDGQVEWLFQKAAADEAVKHLWGVRGVSNRITVRPRQASAPDIAHRIEDALRRTAEVDARRINVTFENGCVVLEGRVRSWLEKEEAEKAAWSAPGVTRIDNRLVVTP
jgi:osmotically-inducible protein OsmY